MAISKSSLATRIVNQWQATVATRFTSPPIISGDLSTAMTWLQGFALSVATGVVDELGVEGEEGGGGGAAITALGVLSDHPFGAEITGQATDGPTARAVTTDNLTQLLNATARLLSIRNAGVEKAAVYGNGKIWGALLEVVGNLIAGGDLDVSGAATIDGSTTVGSLSTSGAVTAASGTFSGAVGAGSVTATGAVSGGSVAATGAVTAASVTASGAVTGGSLTTAGAISGASAALTGDIQADEFKGLAAAPARVTGLEANGASAVGLVVDTANAFTTAGAKLLSIRNAGSEKAYIDKDGNLSLSGTSFNTTGALEAPTVNATGFSGHQSGVDTRAIWRLDESSGTAPAADVMGTYTLSNNSGTPVAAAGKYGNCRLYELGPFTYGSADSGSVSKIKAENWTWGCRFLMTASFYQNIGLFALAHSDGTTNCVFQAEIHSDGKLYAGNHFGTAAGASATLVNRTDWNEFVVTRSGGNYTIYLNGVSQGTATVVNPTGTPATPTWFIGKSPLGTFRGYIDDVWFENRAYNSTEVSNHYYQGYPLRSKYDAIVGRTLFFEGTTADNAIVMPSGRGIGFRSGIGARDMYFNSLNGYLTFDVRVAVGSDFNVSAASGVTAGNTNPLRLQGLVANGANTGVIIDAGNAALTNAGAKLASIRNFGTEKAYFDVDGKLSAPALLLPNTDSSGTPGAATANTASGRAAIAAGASSVVITNSLVTAASRVFCQKTGSSFDATLTSALQVVAASGSFTVYGNANATADVPFNWVVAP